MNTKGRSENLIPAHPGNRNALKSGVYSAPVREEKAREIRSWLEQASLGQLLDELVLGECEKLLTLRDRLEADIDANGVANRRGEMRDIVRARLSIPRRIEKIVERILSLVPQEDDGEEATEPQPGSDKHRDRYEAQKRLAFGPKVPCNVRIDAIQDLWVTRPPARPSPAENEPRQEGGLAFDNSWISALVPLEDERAASEGESSPSCDSQEDSPTTEWEAVRTRCIEVLHAIGTGSGSNARPVHRRRALKLVQSLDPAPPPSLREREFEEFCALDAEGQAHELMQLMPPFKLDEFLEELKAKGLGDRFEIIERGSEGELVLKSASGEARARLPLKWQESRMRLSGELEEACWSCP